MKTAVNNVKTNINSAVTNAVNNVKTTVDKPLISATITTKDSRVTPILDLPLGDKISSENSISKTVGKGNGFINLDITKTIDGNVEGATLSNALGSSVSLSRTGSIGIGQSFGNNELHTSSGIGLGLGEYTFGGSTTTTNGVTNGVDCTFRPGGGAALVSAGAIAIVLSGGTTVPLILAPAEGL